MLKGMGMNERKDERGKLFATNSRRIRELALLFLANPAVYIRRTVDGYDALFFPAFQGLHGFPIHQAQFPQVKHKIGLPVLSLFQHRLNAGEILNGEMAYQGNLEFFGGIADRSDLEH